MIPEQVYEKTKVKVGPNLDGDEYYLNYQNPYNLSSFVLCGPLKTNATAEEFRDKVKKYYSALYKSDINVTRVAYDANGQVVVEALPDNTTETNSTDTNSTSSNSTGSSNSTESNGTSSSNTTSSNSTSTNSSESN